VINVWVHLLDMCHKYSNTTVEDVGLGKEKGNLSHEWHLYCQRVLCAVLQRYLKEITFVSMECYLKFVRTLLLCSASWHSSIHHETEIQHYLMNDKEIVVWKVIEQLHVNSTNSRIYCGKRNVLHFGKTWAQGPGNLLHNPVLDCTLYEGHLTTETRKWIFRKQ
jgi:hypothetical protein